MCPHHIEVPAPREPVRSGQIVHVTVEALVDPVLILGYPTAWGGAGDLGLGWGLGLGVGLGLGLGLGLGFKLGLGFGLGLRLG